MTMKSIGFNSVLNLVLVPVAIELLLDTATPPEIWVVLERLTQYNVCPSNSKKIPFWPSNIPKRFDAPYQVEGLTTIGNPFATAAVGVVFDVYVNVLFVGAVATVHIPA